MKTLKSGPVLALIAFVATIFVFAFFFGGVKIEKDVNYKFNNPQKIAHPELQVYTLDLVGGPQKDLTFRCNPATGEGYFSLNSQNLAWASTHCQDMIGAVRDIEENKKNHAIMNIRTVDNQVIYQVERNTR